MSSATFQISYGASDTGRKSITVPGSFTRRLTKEIQVIIPNTANTVTFTIDIYDELGKLRWSYSGLARNADHLLLVERVIESGYTFGITASGAPGSNIIITIRPEYYGKWLVE